MDLNSDFEQGLTTRPVYRSAYVLVTRQGLSLRPTSLDDPALKKLRLGVFQSSPARQALYEHGISGEVQYLFYDSATAPEEHPASWSNGSPPTRWMRPNPGVRWPGITRSAAAWVWCP